MKTEQLEIAQLKREVVGLKAERARRAVKPSRAGRALRIVRDVLFLAADSLVLGPARVRRLAPPGGKPKVAIMAAHGIGDLVLLLPTLAALLRRYPGSHFVVTFVCSAAAEEFARSVVAADEIISIDRVRLRRDLAYRLALVRRMRRENFAIAVQPNFNRDLLVEDALMRATGAPIRIGSVGTPMFMPTLARWLGDQWYSRLIPAASGVLHELERNAEFMRQLDSAAPAVRAASLLPPQRPPEGPPYMLFVVGSSSPLKSWPLSHFEWLAGALAERTDMPIVFCAGAQDAIPPLDAGPLDAGPPDARLPDEPRRTRRIGQPSQSEFMALIAGARLVVCNDSAAAHIAAALRVPSVCVVGGGIVGRYHPYPPDQAFDTTAPVAVGLTAPMPCFDCGWRCRFRLAPGQPAPCVEAVEPARVLAATLGLLQRSGAP